MALNKASLKTNIVQIMEDMITREENSIDEFAERLSTAVDTYVKEATIIYTAGLTAPNGAVTGTFQGSIE